MKHSLPFLLTTAALMAFTPPTDEKPANPFFAEYKTPFGVPDFGKIKNEHFEPAFEAGMKQQAAAIQRMLMRRDAPTFENTIEAMERSGELLSRVSTVFNNLNSANTSDEIQKIAQSLAPKLSKHRDDISLNPQLFQRVKGLYEQRDQLKLTPEQQRLLEKTYKSFVRSGAALTPEQQERLRAINAEQSVLTLKFGQNLLAENNAYQLVVEKKEDLSGLPASVVAAAADEAKRRKLDGQWVFTLQNPSVMPFLQYADNRALREQILKAYLSRGDHGDARDTKEILAKLVALRAERAKLLGYENHAAYVLEESMAKTPAKVSELLNRLWTAAVPVAQREAAELQALMDQEGKGEKLEAWDWRYYAEKLRKAKYDLDEAQLRPYFALDNVRNGIFTLCQRLYGITFTPIQNIPTYHPEATAYEVKEADGRHVGVMYMDFFPRASKRGGAWMTSYRSQETVGGKRVAPVVSIVCNFTKPTAGQPALLSPDEVTTFFHEFGHALHGLLSNVTYERLAGTSVPRDFVELPSQIMENWAMEPEMLKLYAKHYQTGEVIPPALVDKLKKSSLFDQGFATGEYLAASLLDMAYHTLPAGQTPEASEINAFEKTTLSKLGLIDAIPPRYRSPYFQHIFAGGYSAGYYSYIWSAVLDADAFEVFKQKGLFDKKSADSFRKNVLERGGTDEPMTLYKKFRGAEPDIQPLLRRRGLTKES
jgi:peptidyl-dipeptidase Dcp